MSRAVFSSVLQARKWFVRRASALFTIFTAAHVPSPFDVARKGDSKCAAMPRRVATQVSQLISRQLRGGLLKSTPVAYQTLVAHPPTPLPSRAPVQRTPFDLPPPRGSSWDFDDDLTANGAGSETVAESRSARLARRNGPKLGPQPIIYLEDRVRERFYNDHPWETLQPRMLIEGNVLSERRVPHPNATDLTAWGRNPGPDECVA